MSVIRSALYGAVASVAITLAGCGGGGGGGSNTAPVGGGPPPPPPPPPPPSGKSISVVGSITGFGSVFINGVRYETDGNTVVAIEGQNDVNGYTSGLKLGMKVSLRGTDDNGNRSASRVSFDADLKGLAENVMPDASNPAIGTFTVAGQTVTVDGNTIFDDDVGNNDGISGIDIRDLDPANFPGNTPFVVEVSGFPTDTGIVATRVDRVNMAAGDLGRPAVDGDEVEVKGVVDAVSSDGRTIMINGADFTITSSTVFEDALSADSSLVGRFLEIKADIDSFGDFIAVRVEAEDEQNDFNDDDSFEIEGILQSVDTSTNPNVIRINGLTIEVSDGSSLVSSVGRRVEIKGSFDTSGVLQLSQFNQEVENSIQTEDRVASIDTTALSFTTRLGIEVVPTGASRLEDDLGSDEDLTADEFIQRVRVSDYIQARGFPASDSSISWTRIQREDEDDQDCRLRGPVEQGSISDPEFVIQGVKIDTTGLRFGGFEDENDVNIGRAAFFARLQAGDVVQATSDDAGLGCTEARLATGSDGEVEFEPQDGIVGTAPGGGDGGGGTAGDNEIAGTVANLDTSSNTFSIASRQIQVTDDTLIDASIVERARGVELGPNDIRFGDLPETLDQLISNGDILKVVVDASGNAIQIEDVN